MNAPTQPESGPHPSLSGAESGVETAGPRRDFRGKKRRAPLASWAPIAVGLCVLGASAGSAVAATPDRCQADKDCKALTERAAQFASQTRYEEALSLYQAAYDLSKEPRILVNIGRCHYRLGRSRKAIDAYAKFQAAPFEPEPELQARVKQFVDEAEQAIAADQPAAPPSKDASSSPSSPSLYVPSDVSSAEPQPSLLLKTEPSGRPAWRIGLGLGMVALGLVSSGLGAAAISVNGNCVTPLDSNSNQCAPSASADGNRTIAVVNGLQPGIPLLVGGIVLTVGGIALAAAPARKAADRPTSASK